MTVQNMKYAHEGRDYWLEYVRVNGYSFEPTETGLQRLSRLLDLEIGYLRKCINKYLEE